MVELNFHLAYTEGMAHHFVFGLQDAKQESLAANQLLESAMARLRWRYNRPKES